MRPAPVRVMCCFLMLTLLFGLTACTRSITYRLDKGGAAEYPERERINLAVVLVLDRELFESSYDWTVGGPLTGRTHRLLVGDVLAQNAEPLTRAVFRHVTIVRPADLASTPPGLITMTLRALSAHQGGSAYFAWNVVPTTVSIEWTLKSADGRVVWVQAVNGLGEGRRDKDFDGFRTALRDAFSKSFELMFASVEIRRVASP